jgi:hypothetical protein
MPWSTESEEEEAMSDESVYERARKALDEIDANENDSSQHITTIQYRVIETALDTGEAAERERDAALARVREIEASLAEKVALLKRVSGPLDPPIDPDGTDWTPRKPPKEG